MHTGNIHDKRSTLYISNVISSFLSKGWSACVLLLMIPLTLKCLGAYQNGVWLTISSMLVWIDQMDIGLGNGLRNKLAVSIAHENDKESQRVVSSTMAMLIVIIIPIVVVLLLLVWYTDVYWFLNVQPDIIPELRMALSAGIILVGMTFVLKFIGNVYMGMQLPAISNLLIAIGQTLALFLTAALYWKGYATFMAIVIINTLAPLLVYLLAYPYTFYIRFPQLRPSLKAVNRHSAIDLGNIGIQFFWLQIAGVIQLMTSNILISNFFSPEMVTPYQIAYRYISLILVIFTVICMPFWTATTDAYERGDMLWIKMSNQKMNILTLILGVLTLLMIVISPWVYRLWIGNECHIPLSMTAIIGLYVYLMILSMRYSYFLNGIGVLRLQLYMTVMTVVFIPLSWAISNYTHDILCFLAVMCFCIVPGLVVNMVQFRKIINGSASGIWLR